jgi:peptidoglycan/xylan/chitin deacetylase (PgdA/CDA1 family)
MAMSGALVISLDFELYWGVRDHRTLDGYRENLLGVRTVVPRLIELFSEYGVHATWATVGFLFFETKDELLASLPQCRPMYEDSRLSPYPHIERIGPDEERDPFHYAPSLIRRIDAAPGQEVGTHTFSHYYCLERGQDEAAFEADLLAAISTAQRRGIKLESLVLPRNQVNPRYIPICARLGIKAYRGTERSWLYAARPGPRETIGRRALRLADAYAPLTSHNVHRLDRARPDRPCEVPASRFLRPYDPRLSAMEPLRIRRITRSLERAARQGLVYHLWWHPHNFGIHIERNLSVLREILDHFALMRARYDMQSLSMCEAATRMALTAEVETDG